MPTSDFPLMTNDAFNDMTFFPFYLSVPISYLPRGYSSLNGPWLGKLCNVSQFTLLHHEKYRAGACQKTISVDISRDDLQYGNISCGDSCLGKQ